LIHSDILYQIFGNNATLDNKQSYVLFGADTKGIMLNKLLKDNGFNIKFFIDNDIHKQNTDLHGAAVHPVGKLLEAPESKIILTLAPNFINDVCKQLTDFGVAEDRVIIPENCDFAPFGERDGVLNQIALNENNISLAISLLEDEQSKKTLRGILKYCETLDLSEISSIYDNRYNQYFDEDLIKLNDNEVFVDGGCLDFGTSFQFLQKVSSYKKIYAFEPDSQNFQRIEEATRVLDSNKVKIFNKGIYSEKKIVRFDSLGSFGSRITDSGFGRIETDCLDNLIEEASFIKFDIEGSEYEGLLGGRMIIEKFKPKLAICVYHKLSDLWKIPMLIKEFNESYRLYFRHYRNIMHTETVCYAIPS
jgi:FkbM family methyltransferase